MELLIPALLHSLKGIPSLPATLCGSTGVFILVVMQGLGFGLQNGVKSQFADDAVNSV